MADRLKVGFGICRVFGRRIRVVTLCVFDRRVQVGLALLKFFGQFRICSFSIFDMLQRLAGRMGLHQE